MGHYCGIDLGNKSTALCIIDGERRVLLERTIATDAEEVKAFLGKYSRLKCLVEAAPLAEWLCKVVESAGHEISVVCARKAKRAISNSKKKTDRKDARALAELCRSEWFEPIHRKSEDARELRSYLTARTQLVSNANSLASSIRGIFRAHGIRLCARYDVAEFGTEVRAAAKKLPKLARKGVLGLLASFELMKKQHQQMYREMQKLAEKRADASNLTTIPGVGAATALAFVATIDTPNRFESGEQVASYLGLVPSIYQSGETHYQGRITKQGDKLLRWLLVESAHILLHRTKQGFPLKDWGLKLRESKGAGKARVAVARKLCHVMWEMWRTNQPFRLPESCEA